MADGFVWIRAKRDEEGTLILVGERLDGKRFSETVDEGEILRLGLDLVLDSALILLHGVAGFSAAVYDKEHPQGNGISLYHVREIPPPE